MSPITATAPTTVAPSPAAPAVRHLRWLTASLYLLGLAISVQLVWSTVVRLWSTKGTDFLVIRAAAAALLRGDRLYDLRRIEGELFGASYHLPPFAAVVAAPFALLDEDTALTLWRVLALAAHFGALALLLRVLGIRRSSPLAAGAFVVWAFSWPTRATVIQGQWDAFFLLALAAAWWAERWRRGALAGLLLALAGSVKPFPLLALGYFGTRRRWSAVLGAVVGLALLFGLAFVLAGPPSTTTFLERVAPRLGATTAYAENQSLAGFLARWVEPDMRPVPTEAPVVYLLSRALFVGLLVPLGLLGLRTPLGRYGPELHYAAWVAAAPIGIPASWLDYQELLLLPLLMLAAAWWSGRGPRPSWIQGCLFGAALVLIAFGDHYTVLGPDAGELWKQQTARVDAANQRLLADFAGPRMLLISYKLYGALLLFGLCLWNGWRASVWEGWTPTGWKAVREQGRATVRSDDAATSRVAR